MTFREARRRRTEDLDIFRTNVKQGAGFGPEEKAAIDGWVSAWIASSAIEVATRQPRTPIKVVE